MTRETKIGLLVGLAFIIVIGILLSDHLTSTTEPQQAQLGQVGGNVRSAVTAPGTGNVPLVTNVPPTQNITPQQPVPTKEEIMPRQPPVEIVQIGGAPQTQQPKQPANPPAQPEQIAQGPTAPNEQQPPTLSNQQDVLRTDQPKVPGSIADVAERMGEELVPVGPQNHNAARVLNPTGGKVYKAEPGDNLAKIALKTMGRGSKANCDAIIAANPTLQANPNLIIAGRSYNIPTAAAAPAPTAPQQAPVAPPVVTNEPQPSKADHVYVVQPGDSLTKIAVVQLGSAAAVNAIMDLNQDVLKGGDVIRPNMKLRLPAKPAAPRRNIMVKLLVCLFCAVVLAVVLLQLRQQRLELNHQSNRLHNQIKAQQARLWSQQLEIALYTAPNAISKTVEGKNLKLVPQSPQHTGPSNWMQTP